MLLTAVGECLLIPGAGGSVVPALEELGALVLVLDHQPHAVRLLQLAVVVVVRVLVVLTPTLRYPTHQ